MKTCGAETCCHVFKEPVAPKRNKGLIKDIKAFKLSLSASDFLKNHVFFMGEANLFNTDECSGLLLNTQTLQHSICMLWTNREENRTN